MPEEEVQFLLPDLGEGMTEAEIVRWCVAVGDHVEHDEIVVYVQTDKAEVELPSPVAGTVAALGAAVGDMVPVGGALLELRADPGEQVLGTPVRGSTVSRAPAPPPARAGARSTAHAAPPVRKLARELGVDLADVAGSGTSGHVTEGDVRAAAAGASAESAASAAGTHRVALRGIRRAMAHNMAEAWRTIPHVSLFDEIDARALLAAHRDARARGGDEPFTLTAFFVRAAVLALEAVPILNARLDEPSEAVVYHDRIDIGVATATDDGLTVPVVHDAGARDLDDLGREINRLAASARAGGLSPELLRGATFTVTNFGTQGGRFATPIIRPPQVGILGFGAIRVRPIADGDRVIAAPALPISLSADHRIVDGRDATGFIEEVAALLREPTRLTSRAD